MNTAITTLLEQKGGGVYTIPSTVTVAEAVQEMNTHKIGAVLVMNGLHLAGIFTERDVLRREPCRQQWRAQQLLHDRLSLPDRGH